MRAHEDVGFLRKVLEAVPAYVVLVEADLRIVYINRLQPGFTLDEVIGRSVEDFTAPEYHQRQREAIEGALHTGETQSFVMRAVGADSSVAYYESRAVPVEYNARTRAVCVIALEVTEHVARAEALKKSEERLRLLVDATGMGLWSWDLATGGVEWNTRMHEITGSDHPLAPLEYIEKVVHPDDRARLMVITGELEEHDVEQRLHRVVRPDGSVRWVMPCGRAERDAHGKLVRFMGGALDVTAQHQLEEHVRNAQKINAVGALTAGVAHNFNNMLAVIVPTLDLLLSEVLAGRKRLVLDAAHAAQRASELVADLMTFTGQRSGDEPRVQPLVPIVERAISMCRRTFPAEIAIALAPEHARGSVRCDAMAIEQVIVNLLINARDAIVEAGRETGRVRVEVTDSELVPPGSERATPRVYLRVTVRDEGMGMSGEVQERLFEPFFTTKQPGHGTGLGLATSYGIVRDHGGFLRVEETSRGGTTMAVYLPREANEPPRELSPEPGAKPRPNATVLVVDDESMVRTLVEEVLRMEGHETYGAFDADSLASVLASGVQLSVVLLDRSMPGFPVKTALAMLREHSPHMPILFFTGQDVPASERALVEGVLYKPLSLHELTAAVERWLPRQ